MKNKLEVTRKIFGKKEFLQNFIAWNTKQYGEKSYTIKEALLSDLVTFNHQSLSLKVNDTDEFFMLEETPKIFNIEDFNSYLIKMDRNSEYMTYLEVCEDGYTCAHMFGRGRHLKLFDNESNKPYKYEDLEDAFVRHGIISIYDLEEILEVLP